MTAIAMQTVTNAEGRVTEHLWPLPIAEDFLSDLLKDLFENHYEQIIFGPIIQGAAFELRAPGAPKSIHVGGGYLTVHWGRGGHFHLCVGENLGSPSNPNPPELVAHRRPSKAELFRSMDKREAPVSWGFRMFNGAGEQQVTIFMPNPFLTDEDGMADTPDWSRLALWYKMLKTYAGQEPDGLDTTSQGFKG